MMTFLLPFAGAFLGAVTGNLIVGLMILTNQRKQFKLEMEHKAELEAEFEAAFHDDLL